MNLLELKERIDFLVKSLPHNNPEEIKVLIDCKLSEPTVGARPGTSIKRISLGFDWEMNQLRIEPEDMLWRY